MMGKREKSEKEKSHPFGDGFVGRTSSEDY